MSIDPNINDLLEGGSKTLSWKDAPTGTIHKGSVVAARKTQQTDYQSGKPKFWDDGNPMMQLEITLQTDDRDPHDPGDDGQRREFFAGQKLAALRTALKEASTSLEVGGTIAVQLTGEEPSSVRGGNPKKIYRVQYARPTPGSAIGVDAASLI